MRTQQIWKDLNTPYPINDEQRQLFQQRGWIKLKEVLSAETIAYYDQIITQQVIQQNTQEKPMEERSTYEKAFLQIMNLWRACPKVREFSLSARLGQIAADLLGVEAIRMYHDQALYKEAGGGFTPWHADQYYWPLDTNNTVTVWVPLQETPMPMGPLQFSTASHRLEGGRSLEISDDSEAVISKMLTDAGLETTQEPFDLGEVSYHFGWTYHRAGPNNSDEARRVMTVIYFADGVRVKTPENPNQENDRTDWLMSTPPGELAMSELNPVLWAR